MIRLLFVRPAYKSRLSEWKYPSLGIGYLSAFLKKHMANIQVLLADELAGDNVMEITVRENPDVVAISSTTLEFSQTMTIAEDIKRKLNLPIVIGGVHISALPFSLPDCCNVGVIGEGEMTLLELMVLFDRDRAFTPESLGNISGIVYHKGKELTFTTNREFISNLDEIPMPDRGLFSGKYVEPMAHFSSGFGRGHSLLTSRGCPYKCIYCGSSHFWKKLRFHSAKRVLDEIKLLIDVYKVDYINVFDDLFMASKNRLAEIVDLVEANGINEKVAFGCQAHVNHIDEEVLSLLKRMNVVYLGFGLETGSEKVIRYIKNNVVSVKTNSDAITLAYTAGFKVGSGFMIGNPYEEEDDLKQTYEFVLKHPMHACQPYLTTPLPGTKLWEFAKKEGSVSDDMNWSRINQFYEGKDPIWLNKLGRKNLKWIKKISCACRLSSTIANWSNSRTGSICRLIKMAIRWPSIIMVYVDWLRLKTKRAVKPASGLCSSDTPR